MAIGNEAPAILATSCQICIDGQSAGPTGIWCLTQKAVPRGSVIMWTRQFWLVCCSLINLQSSRVCRSTRRLMSSSNNPCSMHSLTSGKLFIVSMPSKLFACSRFVPPGSKRINSVLVDSSSDRQLDAIAFHTPSNQIVVVAHNQHLDHAVTLRVESAGREETLIYQLPAASIATFVWNES